MNAWQRVVTVAVLAVVPAGAQGCNNKAPGELLMVVDTDMSLPKDIDTITVDIYNNGAAKHHKDYDRIGAGGEVKLPGTLGLIASSEPSDTIEIVVSARRGGAQGDVRVVTNIITTIPTDRVAELMVPIHFLCDGKGHVVSGKPKSTCPEGQSCVAGVCEPSKVDSSKLDTYADDTQVFGDGSCFDSTNCWGNAFPAEVEITACTIPGQKGVNVALQTEGDGICGPAGCFVTLDQDPAYGWSLGNDGLIHLPKAVCTQLAEGKIMNVVTAPVTETCKQKKPNLPTCGPWSASKHNAPLYTGPTALAGAQARPVSLAVGTDSLFWTTAGVASLASSLKSVVIAGGTPTVVASANQAPRDLVITNLGGDSYVYWTSAPGAAGSGGIFKALVTDGSPIPVVTGLDLPEGIAAGGGMLFWADFQSGAISETPLNTSGGQVKKIADGNYPYRLVADSTFVYWTNEGTAGQVPPDGSVMRYNHAAGGSSSLEPVMMDISTPRAITADVNAQGQITTLYWATFEAKGSLMRAGVSPTGIDQPETILSGLDYPNGIATDALTIYWTNRGSGTVMSLSKTASPGTAPTTLAENQLAPSAITVDESNVYWVTEGSSTDPSGMVVKLPK